MSDKSKVKIAFTEAILQQMWVKGLISQQERDSIARHMTTAVENGKC